MRRRHRRLGRGGCSLFPPLNDACHGGYGYFVKALANFGVSVDIRSLTGGLVILEASLGGYIDIVKFLLKSEELDTDAILIG